LSRNLYNSFSIYRRGLTAHHRPCRSLLFLRYTGAMTTDTYRSIAPFYDLLHAGLTQDTGFVLSLAARHPGRVLELGCGTGRLLIPLARAGHRILGLDNSLPMLELARRKLAVEQEAVQRRAGLVAANMTAFGLAPASFTLALVPYNTFLHLDEVAALAALRSITRHLQPGGRLFLDLANPFVIAQTPEDQLLSAEKILADPDSGNIIVVMAANRLRAESQELDITWIYDESPATGGPVFRRVVQVTYHYYFPHEVELLLEQAGLQFDALYGDYNQSAFSESAERLLALASRRH
jgi:SAM-dependent methyltransferase